MSPVYQREAHQGQMLNEILNEVQLMVISPVFEVACGIHNHIQKLEKSPHCLPHRVRVIMLRRTLKALDCLPPSPYQDIKSIAISYACGNIRNYVPPTKY
jgi:hypothetical protein